MVENRFEYLARIFIPKHHEEPSRTKATNLLLNPHSRFHTLQTSTIHAKAKKFTPSSPISSQTRPFTPNIHQNIKRARPHPANLTEHDPRARAPKIIPVAVQQRIAQERHRGLEAHLGERAGGGAQAGAAEGGQAAGARHEVGDEAQVARVDVDAVGAEDGVHLAHGGGARGFDAVAAQHGVHVVGEEPVGVEHRLVLVHGAQVDALGGDDGGFAGEAGGGVARFFVGEGAGGDVRDGLDDGGAAGLFEEVEHD